MKKILFTIAIVFTFGFAANAQFDGFISPLEAENRTLVDPGIFLPPMHFQDGNAPATPLGSGLLILTALGAEYAASRKHKKNF